ncbi:MAG: hypothetical protein GX804_10365 [Lentisphaerae bacterium]|jgi:tetratricopeptide (TPR) repeat protein|nr:hypothetical protein [Lentisphaerota bacterium]
MGTILFAFFAGVLFLLTIGTSPGSEYEITSCEFRNPVLCLETISEDLSSVEKVSEDEQTLSKDEKLLLEMLAIAESKAVDPEAFHGSFDFDSFARIFYAACRNASETPHGAKQIDRMLKKSLDVVDEPANRKILYFIADSFLKSAEGSDSSLREKIVLSALMEDPLHFPALALFDVPDGAVIQYSDLAKALDKLDSVAHDEKLDYAFSIAKATLLLHFEEFGKAFSELKLGETALKKHFSEEQTPKYFYNLKVAVLYEVDEKEDAFNLLDKMLEQYPDNIDFMNLFAYLRAREGERLEEALEMIDAVLKKEPDNCAYLDTLGLVLYKRGDYDGAISSMMRALENGGEEFFEIFDRIGDIYAAQFSAAAGVPWWYKSFQMFPSAKVRDKLLAAGITHEALK